MYYTPTDLGERLGLSAQKVNKLLEAAGLQERIGKDWQPTVQGRSYSHISDVGKRHGSGAPIQQVRWFDSVLPILQAA